MIDGYGDSDDPARRDLPIVATVTVTGDELTVDLTGTAPQMTDRPINMPFEGTVDIAVWLTIRSILLDTAVHGHIPVNEGLTRPISIVAPKGCLANPVFPAPTIARFATGNQLADTVMKAMAQVAAGPGFRWHRQSARDRLFRRTARKGPPGSTWRFSRAATAAATASTGWTRSTRFTPTPATTRSRTSRAICRCACAATSCARRDGRRPLARRSRRGARIRTVGRRRRLDRGRRSPPSSLGSSAAARRAIPQRCRWISGGGARELPSKMPYRRMQAGDRFRCVGPSGGGYGRPADRAPDAVRQDVLDGLLTAEDAARHFGVILDEAFDVDPTATARARAAG